MMSSSQAATPKGTLYKGVYVDDGKSINDIGVSKADLAFGKNPTGLCWLNMDPDQGEGFSPLNKTF